MYLKALLISCLLSVSIQTVLPNPPKPNFKNIIAFGDSYTDNGSFSKFYKSKTYRISKSRLVSLYVFSSFFFLKKKNFVLFSLSPSTSEVKKKQKEG